MPEVMKKMFKVDLQLFNDGGIAGAEGSQAATANAPKTENIPSGSSRRSKSGEFDNVVFGKQEGTTSDEATSLDTEGNPTGAGKTDVSTTSDTNERVYVEWDANSMSIYAWGTSDNAELQCNALNAKYHYLAFT